MKRVAKAIGRLVASASVALGLLAPTGAQAVFVPADIIWVLDTSGSMDNDIAQIKTRITEFNTAMTTAGIDAHYGLVEFGGNSGNGSTSGIATLFQDVVDFATFTAAGSPFNLSSASLGGTEDGSVAVSTALTATFRAGAVKNIILVTDEDDDSSVAQFNAADAGLTAADALFNFIGCPSPLPAGTTCAAGVGNTDTRYTALASAHGGFAFSIDAFRADPDPFFATFVRIKAEEIISQVPEPATILLSGAALLGLGWTRRTRKARS